MTGVQTCALPIYAAGEGRISALGHGHHRPRRSGRRPHGRAVGRVAHRRHVHLRHARGAAAAGDGHVGRDHDAQARSGRGGEPGGGAGAGAAGNQASSPPTVQAGGNGIAYDISGTSTYYAGGGGGSVAAGYGGTPAGGLGGGGAGSKGGSGSNASYYGGGGGAGYNANSAGASSTGGNGYQGIVIISYAYVQPKINNYFLAGPTANKISFSLKDTTRLFYGLSAGARMNMMGVFALKKLTEYNGPVIDVQRQSDNVTASVYADTSGNLTVSGTALPRGLALRPET